MKLKESVNSSITPTLYKVVLTYKTLKLVKSNKRNKVLKKSSAKT